MRECFADDLFSGQKSKNAAAKHWGDYTERPSLDLRFYIVPWL
jgi:hypothetical protein